MKQKTKTRVLPTYDELEKQLKDARLEMQEYKKKSQDRIIELERLLMKMGYKVPTVKQQKNALKGLPLFDLLDEQVAPAEPEAPAETDKPETEEIRYIRKKNGNGKGKGKQGRRGLPEHLERKEIRYEVDLKLFKELDPMGNVLVIDYERSEELMYTPPEFYVNVHLRPVVLYTTTDGESRVGAAGGPNKVFDKCMASPEILAKIATDRCDAALTLFRIERNFKDLGCHVHRSTMSTWMVRLGELLEPIAKAQMYLIMNGFKVHLDDTNINILETGKGKGKGGTDKEKVWVFVGGDPQNPEIVFKHTPARNSKTVWDLLGSYSGYSQVDACGVYDDFFSRSKAKEVGCWSHVFRRFDEIKEVESRAKTMLGLIRKLCDVEDEAKGLPYSQVKDLRIKKAIPILNQIKKWIKKQRKEEVLESSYKKALNYVHNQWENLIRYLQDGRLCIDNNIAESEFHVLGVTRRNHLFWGPNGIKSGMVIMGLIRSCRKNGINPYEYLCDVIHKVTETEMPARELIPSRWKQIQESKKNSPSL